MYHFVQQSETSASAAVLTIHSYYWKYVGGNRKSSGLANRVRGCQKDENTSRLGALSQLPPRDIGLAPKRLLFHCNAQDLAQFQANDFRIVRLATARQKLLQRLLDLLRKVKCSLAPLLSSPQLQLHRWGHHTGNLTRKTSVIVHRLKAGGRLLEVEQR